LNHAIRGLQKKLTVALDKGYAGLRINGNEAWLTAQEWNAFSDYEHKLNQMIVDLRMIVLCTYPLAVTTAQRGRISSPSQRTTERGRFSRPPISDRQRKNYGS
jgi:hypothetical protein